MLMERPFCEGTRSRPAFAAPNSFAAAAIPLQTSLTSLKSSFEEAWEHDFDILDATSRRHLRDDNDVNQWLIRIRQLAEGTFIPRKRMKNCNFEIHEDQELMHRIIREQMRSMICLNDTQTLEEAEFRRLQSKIRDDFECILHAQSRYEK